MATMPVAPPPPARSLPIAPTEEAWRAMSPDERSRFLEKVVDSLSDPRETMSEGRPHKKVKTRSLDMLGLHFGAVGRVVYLAEEMAVLYPGEEVFTPDVLAVLDVGEPEDDERMAWVVAEGASGKAQSARRYQAIVPQGGRYRSAVLGLDLVIDEGTLRFFHGMADLFGSADLIRRLSGMVGEREAKAEQAKAEKAEQAILGLRTGIPAALETRGIAVEEDLRARVHACDEPLVLQRWLLRALSVASAGEVFAAEQAT